MTGRPFSPQVSQAAGESCCILPPGPIGLLGGGQLGRMFALAAKAQGYRIHVLTDAEDSPAAQVADEVLVGEYTDVAAVRKLAQTVRVMTVEFENVSAAAAEAATAYVPLRPGARSLAIAQHRYREKMFFSNLGIPVAAFALIEQPDDVSVAVNKIGGEGILKTCESGYDGKGQIAMRSGESLTVAWQELGCVPCVYEQRVEVREELSMVAARNPQGALADWGLFLNVHENHILSLTTTPPPAELPGLSMAKDYMVGVLNELEYVGVLCIEFFLTTGGQLLVNEMAPRPHNSGHLTIEASVTSQFEQQVRAVCGLPLGSTKLHGPAAMMNLLGEACLAPGGKIAAALEDPRVKLHLYGKQEARAGRKMGHLTALGSSVAEARKVVQSAHARFSGVHDQG